MTTHDVVIVADDVTGAGDTAVQFARHGWTAELRLRTGTSEAQVVAVSTDSRACTDDEAARLARTALAETRATHVFKKIDSTLRGAIRAEVDAVLETLGPDTTAVVCPAFPGVGRTLTGGTLLVDGTPVAQTSVGRDPVTPVTDSHVPTLLDAPSVQLDPAAGPAEHAERIRDAGRVVVVDAETDADLDRLAVAIDALGTRALPVGAAGLAGALARRWRADDTRRAVAAPTASGPHGPALVVVSSLHAAARRQVRALVDDGARQHQPTPGQLLDEHAWTTFADTVLADTEAHADGADGTVVLSAPERGDVDVPPTLVARRLADLAARMVRTAPPAGIVVTGGDGARALLDRLDSTGIRLDSRPADGSPPQHTPVDAGAGVAVGTVVGGWARGLPVATKAGGFGDTDVLITAAHAVRRKRSTP